MCTHEMELETVFKLARVRAASAVTSQEASSILVRASESYDKHREKFDEVVALMQLFCFYPQK